jgi:trans-2,3-dihydro-3-hydroxyanthranilate isomerase
MLAFARETGLSETTFVQATASAGADYRKRIFDPRQELAFAGHPSLGTAVAIAAARGDHEARYIQQTHAGLQPIDVRRHDRRAEASMLQEPPEFGPLLDVGEVLGVVGLPAEAADRDLPVQVVATGVPQVLAPVRAPALAEARPDYARIQALLDQHEALVLYLVTVDVQAGRARARAYTHSADVGEDPATGSAAGPLCAYLHERTGLGRLEIVQGVEMGRPSRLECRWQEDRPRVGGGVAVVIEGAVWL